VYEVFFGIGYDVFLLSRAADVKLPGGVPVFPEVRMGQTPEEVLAKLGYVPGPTTYFDAENKISLVNWTPKAPA
jgi:hypothetical protein